MGLCHVPVLLKEVIEVIAPKDGGRYFDGTLGAGGHAKAILDKSAPRGELAGTDLDQHVITGLSKRFSCYGERARLFNKNYTEIDHICAILGWESLDGIILDLGMSSFALEDPERGFSFLRQGPLDMRFSLDNPLDAYKVVNAYPKDKLARVLSNYGQERFASRIAHAIIKSRPIETTIKLADVVSSSIPRRFWPKKIHPATKTFQAVRIEVNKEISNLEEFLPKAIDLLSPEGVLAVISFHSLEDRVAKHFFIERSRPHNLPRGLPVLEDNEKPGFANIFKKSVTPSSDEILSNPRARSARLRAVRRLIN
ncbi:MAG: 16S rRNA (cytosine(1402)-N(4))-methyltransferase RsmH [Thermodesulfobacteriota bacterium]|nr:16S rRNA (cytosine(1402)-N(4))-methyltransferase RsmH [Thermodesulfobacteriota bacterium]